MTNFGNWLNRHVRHMSLKEKIALGREYGVPHPKDPHPEFAKKKTRKKIKDNGISFDWPS